MQRSGLLIAALLRPKARLDPPGQLVAHLPIRVEPLLARLQAAAATPQACFVYAHLTEPHEPYDRGALKTGPAFERYFSEVVLADALVGRIATLLSSPVMTSAAPGSRRSRYSVQTSR